MNSGGEDIDRRNSDKPIMKDVGIKVIPGHGSPPPMGLRHRFSLLFADDLSGEDTRDRVLSVKWKEIYCSCPSADVEATTADIASYPNS